MSLFFRLVRFVLTPIMLLAEWFTTPNAISRSPQQQADVNTACTHLALYQFKACPFCIKVRKEMARLGLHIEKRDVQHNVVFREQLQAQGGKVKVPCLRIETHTGDTPQVQWLYESNAIIDYLQQRFSV